MIKPISHHPISLKNGERRDYELILHRTFRYRTFFVINSVNIGCPDSDDSFSNCYVSTAVKVTNDIQLSKYSARFAILPCIVTLAERAEIIKKIYRNPGSVVNKQREFCREVGRHYGFSVQALSRTVEKFEREYILLDIKPPSR